MKYVLIHGTLWNPNENWFPWLKQHLEEQWHKVFVPHFPTPENQTIKAWCEVLRKEASFEFDQDTVIIGHSLWALYILHILNSQRKNPIHHAVLISGFSSKLGNETFDTLNQDFLTDSFDRSLIKQNANRITLFHGTNDPYVPIEQAKILEEKLDAELYPIEHWWHLNEAAWYREFPKLLEVL